MDILKYLVIIFLILSVLIFLQILLSNKQNKWFGLFIPLLTLLFATAVTLQSTNDIRGISFFLWNIPTVLYLIIYVVCKERLKKKSDIVKMNIHDLD